MTTVTTMAATLPRPMPRARRARPAARPFLTLGLAPLLELALFVLTSALPTLMLAAAATSLF